jgi:hypothetical protein
MARVYIDTDVDVDVDDFLEECNEHEIEEVIKWLNYNDYLRTSTINERSKNLMDLEWDKAIEKLHSNRIQLTPSEEEFIKTIANRL